MPKVRQIIVELLLYNSIWIGYGYCHTWPTEWMALGSWMNHWIQWSNEWLTLFFAGAHASGREGERVWNAVTENYDLWVSIPSTIIIIRSIRKLHSSTDCARSALFGDFILDGIRCDERRCAQFPHRIKYSNAEQWAHCKRHLIKYNLCQIMFHCCLYNAARFALPYDSDSCSLQSAHA